MYAARSLFDAVEARIGNRIATLARLLGAVLLVSHIAACAFFLLARYQFIGHSASAMRWRCTWIQDQISNGVLRVYTSYQPRDQPEQYLRALNWALPTLVVVVIGDVTPATCKETLFVFCCIALGAWLLVTVLMSCFWSFHSPLQLSVLGTEYNLKMAYSLL